MLGGDEGSLLIIARFFLKEYQFVTDSYRMFAALSRMCHSPVNYYADSANQKFMLRQVKSMDYALIDQELRDNQLVEKVSYTTKKEDGELIVNDDMDIALIMLYGHILYAGQSYAQALSRCLL
jgi:general transcription factor 3C polypeptide 3 (transcription factor C subunit 4)